MIKVLITGGGGFLGRNLAVHLRSNAGLDVAVFTRSMPIEELDHHLHDADVVFHLAGVNRPRDPSEFEAGNAEFTRYICDELGRRQRAPKIIFSSSIQAGLENPYGRSKLKAESALQEFANDSGAPVRIYRLHNLFGKWSRPDYNSVTATFCHNIANDLPIMISDPARTVDLTYVDDVVQSFRNDIEADWTGVQWGPELRSYRICLGDLAGRIDAFHEMKTSVTLADFSDWFNRALYATFLSYVPYEALESRLEVKADNRGSLAEFLKQPGFGQVFVSRTKPGITRGNHFHHTKTEKFFVVEGQGLIRMRPAEGGPVREFKVRGEEYSVVDIPPGVTHSIKNVGDRDMVTLFWSSEIFDPDRPDTFFLPVDIPVPESIPSLEKA